MPAPLSADVMLLHKYTCNFLFNNLAMGNMPIVKEVFYHPDYVEAYRRVENEADFEHAVYNALVSCAEVGDVETFARVSKYCDVENMWYLDALMSAWQGKHYELIEYACQTLGFPVDKLPEMVRNHLRRRTKAANTIFFWWGPLLRRNNPGFVMEEAARAWKKFAKETGIED